MPPVAPAKSKVTPEKRQQVVEDLAAGKISMADAMEILNG